MIGPLKCESSITLYIARLLTDWRAERGEHGALEVSPARASRGRVRAPPIDTAAESVSTWFPAYMHSPCNLYQFPSLGCSRQRLVAQPPHSRPDQKAGGRPGLSIPKYTEYF